MLTHVIIGAGEVGQAITKVTQGTLHDPYKEINAIGEFDVLNVCFPYSDNFVELVKEYAVQFQTAITIIHSTVPVGTSKLCNAVHSPVRGVHPFLFEGVKTFVKYFGGDRAREAALIFSNLGLTTSTTPNSDNTEAAKLWDTTQYGLFILMNRQIKAWCDEKGLDFGLIYTNFNETYNDGYAKLGRSEVMRPVLKHTSGKIGGHCVRQNAWLLSQELGDLFDKSI